MARKSDLKLDICNWIQVISQSVSMSGLCLTTKSGLVVMKTLAPLLS